MKLQIFLLLALASLASAKKLPIVVNTWPFTNATRRAFEVIQQSGKSAIDAVVEGCTVCEEQQCDGSVGFGGSPNEEGETTLDAMIMDGRTMKVGAVASLREIREAIAVARHVLDYTKHTLLVGDQATDFAVKMGFERRSLSTPANEAIINSWRNSSCQPNYWMNVVPKAEESCGPYVKGNVEREISVTLIDNDHNHDTIGMVAIDANGDVAAGTSTNGLTYKIPGRVGDSPIPGSGAYADNDIGGAAATGDGDVMMRFSASFLAVELLRSGHTVQEAADTVISRIGRHYPENSAAVVVVDKEGNVGAACQIFSSFPVSIYHPELSEVKVEVTKCRQSGETTTTAGSKRSSSHITFTVLFVVFVSLLK